MRIAVIGANGQLGSDLVPVLTGAGHEVVGLAHAQVEVSEQDAVRSALGTVEPDLVINTAAYHKVDEVEDNPDKAFAVNATGARNVAIVCKDLNAVLCYISTDYVFSGRKGSPYVETDPADPVNVYGVSKAAGEMLVRYTWPKHFIVRTSGLYGHAGSSGKGGNFVETMLRLAREGRPIRVVNDQTLTPTSTQALASQIASLIETDNYGTFHATCQGECTWFDFASAVFRLTGVSPELSTQTTTESGAKAWRPPYSVLENSALEALGIDGMPHWERALEGYLEHRGSTAR